MLSSTLLSPLGQTKIYLYAKPVDMRRSFDGLHAIVQSEFHHDIRSGDVFVFLNRRLDRIKLLHWDRDGLAIWMKRLERGTFQRPGCPAGRPGGDRRYRSGAVALGDRTDERETSAAICARCGPWQGWGGDCFLAGVCRPRS